MIPCCYYPKTDNTYSPLSSCRYELAPGLLALPNLSRRSISGVRSPSLSTVRTLWTETETNIDSDTEEWEHRSVNTSSSYHVQRKSVFTRVITSIWTVFTIIYAYTIGSVISVFTSAGSSRQQDSSKVPLLLYPIWWLMKAARRVSLWETQTGAWLSKRQRRNWLLALLLLLLVGLPIYFLYAGDTQEDALEQTERTGFFHWLTDGITDLLLVARSPLTWLLSASRDLIELIKSTAILPVNWLYSLGSWLISFGLWLLSPIFWIFAAVTSNKTENADALKAAYMMTPPLAAPSVSPMVFEINKQVNAEVDVDLLAKKVLESQAFVLLMSQLKDGSSKSQDSQAAGLAKLAQELNELKTQIMSMNLGAETNHNSEHLALLALQGKTRNLERMIRVLQVRLGDAASKACCEKINDQVVAIMGGMVGGADDDAKASAELLAEMKAKLAELEQLEARLAQFSLNLEASQQSKMDEFRTQLLKISTDSKSTIQIEGTSDERVLAIVKETLAQYDADKTNLVDYALETSGGTILSTRCTENYDYKHGETFYFGLSWFSKEYRPNNPRTIIQPSVHPGECWAFKGATGYVVIELSAKIRIMAVTMEHIPLSLAPNGRIESAPKDFSIWGLVDLKDPEPLFLGKFRYEDNGEPLQSFEVEIEHDAYRNLELRVESNHGHVEYTCVYRFRVHGVPDWS